MESLSRKLELPAALLVRAIQANYQWFGVRLVYNLAFLLTPLSLTHNLDQATFDLASSTRNPVYQIALSRYV
jgi:hypothetical protein